MIPMTELITVEPEDTQTRADRLIADKLDNISRSYVSGLFEEGRVTVDGKPTRPSAKLKQGQVIAVDMPELTEPEIIPENLPLDIIYEDDSLLIVNKPKNMVVHPAPGHYSGTLVNALMYHCRGSLSGINGIMRPGIVHRIDKDTTGSLIVCKTDESHRALSEQLSVHSIKRKYRAIVHGRLKEQHFTIDKNITRDPKDRKKMCVTDSGGREAVTDVDVLEELQGYTYVECTLHTGRTHQIRVHMASVGHPVLGDETYGPKKCPVKGLAGQTLHAYLIGFVHPVTGVYMEFTAPVPDYFKNLLQKLR